jgi:hypothetical protein
LRELDAYYRVCRKQSDSRFLLIPSEEGNTYLGGHWSIIFPHKVLWFMTKPAPGPLTRRPSAEGVLSPSGVYGDATLATWQKGERIAAGRLGDILQDIDALAAAPVPAGTPRSPLDPVAPET